MAIRHTSHVCRDLCTFPNMCDYPVVYAAFLFAAQRLAPSAGGGIRPERPPLRLNTYRNEGIQPPRRRVLDSIA